MYAFDGFGTILMCPLSYGVQYHGQMALQAGILVAFTQLMPEHQIQILGVFRVRVKV